MLAVDARKQARLARGAAAWLRARPSFRSHRARLDVIACLRSANGWHLEHWPGAFDAPGG